MRLWIVLTAFVGGLNALVPPASYGLPVNLTNLACRAAPGRSWGAGAVIRPLGRRDTARVSPGRSTLRRLLEDPLARPSPRNSRQRPYALSWTLVKPNAWCVFCADTGLPYGPMLAGRPASPFRAHAPPS